MKSPILLLIGLFLVALLPPLSGQSPLHDLQLPTIHGQAYALQQAAEYQISVFFFLAPECPLCENYARSIKELRQQFDPEQVSFYGIFAGDTYTDDEIVHYLARFRLPVKALRDPDYQLVAHFGARVTPEVFVVAPSGNVLYRGKIDNWIAALGKKRPVATRFYLRDAIEASLKGEGIAVSQTEAVGCLIE
ncbi:MAG: redoxin domain-containing protein [Bacteroidota bacterium]